MPFDVTGRLLLWEMCFSFCSSNYMWQARGLKKIWCFLILWLRSFDRISKQENNSSRLWHLECQSKIMQLSFCFFFFYNSWDPLLFQSFNAFLVWTLPLKGLDSREFIGVHVYWQIVSHVIGYNQCQLQRLNMVHRFIFKNQELT